MFRVTLKIGIFLLLLFILPWVMLYCGLIEMKS